MEDATILGLILIAATSADELTEALLGEHVSPIIEGLLTASLWVMVAIYAISVLGTMRKLVSETLLPRPDSAGVVAMARPNARRQGTTAASREKEAAEVPLSVLVVDDDVLVTMAVKHVLAADDRIGVITTANSPDAALARIAVTPRDEAPDVVLMDINYVGCEKTGIEALAEFRAASPASKLLIMSVCRGCAETVRAAVANEADGFIWKNESAVDFAEAVVGTAHHGFITSKSIAHELLEVS